MKENKVIEHKREDENQADNQFEILSRLPKIHGSDLKQSISADYTLATLEENERTFIKETYENAGFIRFIIEKLRDDSYEYKWVPEKQGWEMTDKNQYKKIPLDKDKRKVITEYARYIFKSLMISPDILTVLKRNDKDNFLLRLLGDVKVVDESGEEKFSEDEDTIERIKMKLNENR